MRRWILYSIASGVLLSATPQVVQAGSEGRRNTAIATTAVAVAAWSNGTGKAGRRNTALVATAGAAYAWKRYADKKKEERRRPVRRTVVVASHSGGHRCNGHWVPPGHRCPPGRRLGHHKHHWKECKHVSKHHAKFCRLDD